MPYQSYHSGQSQTFTPPPDIPAQFDALEAKAINEKAETLGKAMKERNVKTNQVRKFFSNISSMRTHFKQIKDWGIDSIELKNLKRELILLKPNLAYSKGRHKELEDFQNTMFKVIDSVDIANDSKLAFENFFFFVEAIVAYHKYYGGKD